MTKTSRTVSSMLFTLVKTIILLTLALILGASIMGGTLAARDQGLVGPDSGETAVTADGSTDSFVGRAMTFARYFFEDLVVVAKATLRPGNGSTE